MPCVRDLEFKGIGTTIGMVGFINSPNIGYVANLWTTRTLLLNLLINEMLINDLSLSNNDFASYFENGSPWWSRTLLLIWLFNFCWKKTADFDGNPNSQLKQIGTLKKTRTVFGQKSLNSSFAPNLYPYISCIAEWRQLLEALTKTFWNQINWGSWLGKWEIMHLLTVT